MRKKTIVENESEMKHSDEDKDKEPKKDMPKEDEAATPKGEHPDEEQDKKLIGDMVKKYLGDGEHSEEDMQQAGECMKHAKELGYEGEEAMHAAGHHMQMMKHKAKKESEAKEAEAKKEAESHKEDEAETKEKAPPPTHAKPTEAQVAELEADKVALAGRVAKLEEENKKFRLADYLDKKLKESKLSRQATGEFRKELTVIRSEKDIDEKLNLFVRSYELGLKEANQSPYILSVEKNIEITESKTESPTYDLSKFVR